MITCKTISQKKLTIWSNSLLDEDKQSITAKAAFARKKKLAGVTMFEVSL